MRINVLGMLFAATLALGSTGCVKKMILNSQIHATRIGAGAADTIGDYEIARGAASAGGSTVGARPQRMQVSPFSNGASQRQGRASRGSAFISCIRHRADAPSSTAAGARLIAPRD